MTTSPLGSEAAGGGRTQGPHGLLRVEWHLMRGPEAIGDLMEARAGGRRRGSAEGRGKEKWKGWLAAV